MAQHRAAIHLNSDIIATVDTETVGLAEDSEIVQVAIIPLDSCFEPNKNITPFIMLITPTQPLEKGNTVARPIYDQAKQYGTEKHLAADLLNEWFENLKLPEGKRIQPLAQNWPFDRQKLINWLGLQNFSYIFSHRYRDLLCAASMVNDIRDARQEKVPFHSYTLAGISKVCGIEHNTLHEAVEDALLTAKCYKKIVYAM